MFHTTAIHREITNVSLVSDETARAALADVMLRGDILSQLPAKYFLEYPASSVLQRTSGSRRRRYRVLLVAL